MLIKFNETAFRTMVGPEGNREVYILDLANLLPGAAEPAAIAAYLIQRGLDETLGNAWSTQPADGRTHAKVAERLRRIQTDPGSGGRVGLDEITRETMALIRKRLAASGVKAEVLKAASTPDKLRAELVRALGGDNAKAALVWDKLYEQAAQIVALRASAVTATAFDDLLAD